LLPSSSGENPSGINKSMGSISKVVTKLLFFGFPSLSGSQKYPLLEVSLSETIEKSARPTT